MEWIPVIWIGLGWSAHIYLGVREGIFTESNFGWIMVWFLMLFPAAIAGPLLWLVPVFIGPPGDG